MLYRVQRSLLKNFQNNWIGWWFPNWQVLIKSWQRCSYCLPFGRHREFPQQSPQSCYLVLSAQLCSPFLVSGHAARWHEAAFLHGAFRLSLPGSLQFPWGFVQAAGKESLLLVTCCNAARDPGNEILAAEKFLPHLTASSVCLGCAVIPAGLWHPAPSSHKAVSKPFLQAPSALPGLQNWGQFSAQCLLSTAGMSDLLNLIPLHALQSVVFKLAYCVSFLHLSLYMHTCIYTHIYVCVYIYAFDCCWLHTRSCLDTTVWTISTVVYTDWRIQARNVSHRKPKMKPRRDY